MKDQGEVFRSNTLMILVPGLFFGAGLILRQREDLYVWMWALLTIGAITAIALIFSFTTLTIKNQEIRIKNFKKSHFIHLDDIARQTRDVSTSKGIESIIWKLYLKNGKEVKIPSDLFKEKEELKESLDHFLSSIPKK